MSDQSDNEFLEFDRLHMIQDTIKKYGEENFYISFSGGRDSTVLSKFVDIAVPGNKIPRVFCNTGIEFNAIVDFVKECQKEDDRVVIVFPKTPIVPMLKEDGYPFKSKDHCAHVEYYHKHMNEELPYWIVKYRDHYNAYGCPPKLKYQFTPEFNLHISDKCCKNLKEDPLHKWSKENNKPITMMAVMSAEGGRRKTYKQCASFKNGKLKSFSPFKPVRDSFIDYLVEKYDIKLCKLYYPPYNFPRTGCKGCPFNIYLQRSLNTMKELMPDEYKQCETIWKPVYDEYRRVGYRLKPIEEDKEEKTEQLKLPI